MPRSDKKNARASESLPTWPVPLAHVARPEDDGLVWSVWVTCLEEDAPFGCCPWVLWCRCSRDDETGARLKFSTQFARVPEGDALDAADALNAEVFLLPDGSARVRRMLPRLVQPVADLGLSDDEVS